MYNTAPNVREAAEAAAKAIRLDIIISPAPIIVIIMTVVNIKLPIYPNNQGSNGTVSCLISYEPFWQTLKKKKITTYALINKHNISSATIDRMKKGGGISTMKIDDFCRILHCEVSDIIQYIEDE